MFQQCPAIETLRDTTGEFKRLDGMALSRAADDADLEGLLDRRESARQSMEHLKTIPCVQAYQGRDQTLRYLGLSGTGAGVLLLLYPFLRQRSI